MASSFFQIPPGKTIGDITDVRSQKIRDWLKKVDFKLDDAAIDAAIKPQLQAILTLYKLGILRKGCGPDEALLSTVTEWCSISVKKLVGKLKYRGLDMNGNRWQHIEVLIRAELDNGESTLAKLSVVTPDNVTEGATESTPAISQDLTSSPAVLNLLVTTIYAEVARSNDLASLPGCPTPTVNLVLDQLKTFRAFKTLQELEAVRKAPLTPAKILLNWISNKYGDQLKEATGSLKIKAMPSSILQFVVSTPIKELQDAFVVRKAAKNDESILLFHGARLPNLRDILQTNFNANNGLVWASGQPWIPWDYAAGVIGGASYIRPPSAWKGDPYTNFGALMGCEVTHRNPTRYIGLPDEDVHTYANPNDIMVKYIFLLPPSVMPTRYTGTAHPSAPSKAAVTQDIFNKL